MEEEEKKTGKTQPIRVDGNENKENAGDTQRIRLTGSADLEDASADAPSEELVPGAGLPTPEMTQVNPVSEAVDPDATQVNPVIAGIDAEATQVNPVIDPDATQVNPIIAVDPDATRVNEVVPPAPIDDATIHSAVTQANVPSVPAEPPMLERTPVPAPPLIGKPLSPEEVQMLDPEATTVVPTAWAASAANEPVTSPVSGAVSPARPAKGSGGGAKKPPAKRGKADDDDWRKPISMVAKIGIVAAFLMLLVAVGAGSFLVYKYFSIASSLPSVADLKSKAAQFETTRIVDRNGALLYEIIDPNGGLRTYVPLEKMSPYMVAATLATEDKDYYSHAGFDPVAIARAMWVNYTSGGIVSGASTITQQLARSLLLTDERYDQSVDRKAREIVLAAEITRKYSKEEILELYLNEYYYGKLSYGVEAAAETYFKTTADKLTLAQAAFLAGIPQSPVMYDVERNREGTMNRFQTVIVLMNELSNERGCIYVSTSAKPVCVDRQAAVEAVNEMQNYQYQPPAERIKFPHWVDYIRKQLELMYDPGTIYRSGFTVTTTLDPVLQEEAQRIVTENVAALAANDAHNGALLALKPQTGEILAMVGSPNFYDDQYAGQINMTIMPRQPGSAMKPLVFAAAFEKGWTPATTIWDVPVSLPPSGVEGDPSEPYRPVNYDGRFHGPVSVRLALGSSYNIPAVKALQYVGIYDDAATPENDGLIGFARKLGITTLTRNDYGLALALGGGEVSLMEMTGAYSVFANEGKLVNPIAITKIVDFKGNLVYEYQVPEGKQVYPADFSYLMSSIMSDNGARTPAFGANSVLNVGFPAAVKTGTTNDFRDNLTIGYTPDVVVGVWVGNADNSEMINTTGVTGAAPIWAQFITFANNHLTQGQPRDFAIPSTIYEKEICAISGTEPSEECPTRRMEIFAQSRPPLSREYDFWKPVEIDTWTGLLASAACPDFKKDALTLNVKDETAVKWIKETDEGREWAKSMRFEDPIYFIPERSCSVDDPRPTLLFASLRDGDTIRESPLPIYAVIKVPTDFRDYRLEWGAGSDPQEWNVLFVGDRQSDQAIMLKEWDTLEVKEEEITLRLYLTRDDEKYAERKIRLRLDVPTPTPTPTQTPLPTATATATFTSTSTFTATVPPPPTATALPPTATSVPPTAPPSPPPTDTPAVPTEPVATPTP